MHTAVKISGDLNRAIMLRSVHPRNKPRSKALHHANRQEADFGTKSYRDGLQRAFNKAKEQIFFNPDMQYFITLTYAKQDNTVEEVLHDVKMLIKKEKRLRSVFPAGSGQKPFKYIFVMEYQKRGSIHVHMIANDCFTLQVNKNGYKELTHWQKGFSSVLHITDLDNNFRPYLYLFKYMKKSQRIGKSFVHSSRNLNNYTELSDAELNLLQWRTITQELTTATIQNTKFTFYKNYLQFDDTIQTHNNNFGGQLWLEQVKLHSTRELEKLVKNHSKLSNSISHQTFQSSIS